MTDRRMHVMRDRRPVMGLGFSRDGRQLFGVTLRMLLAWDVDSGATVVDPIFNERPENIASALDVGPDGTTIAVQLEGLAPPCTMPKTLERRRVMETPTHAAREGFRHVREFDPSETQVAAGYGRGFVVLWDVATGHPVGFPVEAHDMVMSIAFNHDGSISRDRRARCRDQALGCRKRLQARPTITGHDGGVLSLVFHPDPEHPQLFSSSFDRTIRVWDYKQVLSWGHRLRVTQTRCAFLRWIRKVKF